MDSSKVVEIKQNLPDFSSQVGKEVYFLYGYDWMRGTLISVGKTNLKIAYSIGCLSRVERKIPVVKCALPTEQVCVVWETWKGVNGRGGYRVERVLYTPFRVMARNVYTQDSHYVSPGRVTESIYGTIKVRDSRGTYLPDYKDPFVP